MLADKVWTVWKGLKKKNKERKRISGTAQLVNILIISEILEDLHTTFFGGVSNYVHDW